MKNKKIRLILAAIILCAIAGIVVICIIANKRIDKIQYMSFEEMIEYTTKDTPDAVIAVGFIQNGETTYKYYGENGAILADIGYEYEIGSITKTMTTSILCKLVYED